MLRLGNHIRLTSNEVARFTTLTAFAPTNIRTLDDLDAYIGRCKKFYWGTSEDTRFLHWLMDQERLRCCTGGGRGLA